MNKLFDKKKELVRENVISIKTEQTATINDDIVISGSLSPSLSRTSTDISSLDTAACEISSSALSLSSKPPTPKVRNRFTNVLKSIRPRTLVPKRFKSDLTTELKQEKQPLNTPQVGRKSISINAKTENNDGGEKLKKKSRASSFVKKFTIGKKSKAGLTLEKGSGDQDSASSFITTPTSEKKPTPDVIRQSVSEKSLHDIDKDVDLTPPQPVLQENKQYFTRGAQLRIKISGHKATVKKSNETETLTVAQSNTKNQHLELHKEGLAVVIDSGSEAITFPKASQQTKDIQLPVEVNKKSGEIPTVEKQFIENAKSLIPHLLDVKSDHLQSECKPINTVELKTSSPLQRNLTNNLDNIGTIDNIKESGIRTTDKPITSDSITEKLFKLFTPTQEIVKVPTESVSVDNCIPPTELTKLIDGNKLVTKQEEEFSLFGDNFSKSLMTHKTDTVVTKSETENKSLARSENTLKKQKSEDISSKSGGFVTGTVSDTSKSEKSKGAVKKELSPPPNPNRERRPSLKEELEETGAFLPIRADTASKVVKPERKSPIRSVSVDAKLESNDQVEVTCQQGNNIENPNLSGFKITESYGDSQVFDGDDSSDLQLIVEPVDIESNILNFNIGKSVRPQQTSLKLTSDTKELASIHYKITSVDSVGSNFSSSNSVDDCTYSSISPTQTTSPDSLSPSRSERARRRIAYIDQTTIDNTIDEKELFENWSFEPISSNYLSGLSGDFATTATFDSPDLSIDIIKKMPPIGALFIDNADVSAAMSTTSPEKREHLYKILVIGELGTGKTSFIKRYVHQFFSQSYRATIGVDFALKVLNWDQNTIIRLQLWDIAGQERFGNMTRVYYKEAVGAFIVFDVTRSATFDAAIKWKQDLDSKVQLPDGSSIPCILLANKCDQQKQGIVNTPAKMDEYVEENGFAGWFETSAKENINIEDAARALVNKILLNDKLLSSGEIIDAERFALDAKNDEATKKNCAC